MERLTDQYWRSLDPWECCGQDNYCKRGCHDSGVCNNGCIVPKLYCRLAAIEEILGNEYDLDHLRELVQAEQDGRLVKLPCKVGDKLYRISLGEYVVYEIEVDQQFISDKRISLFAHFCLPDGKLATSYEMFDNSEIGRTIFLTREEAEAALEKEAGGLRCARRRAR